MEETSYKVEEHLAQVSIAGSHLGIYFAPEKVHKCQSSSPSRLHMGFVPADGCTTVDADSFRPPGLAHLLRWAIYVGRQQQLHRQGQAGSDLAMLEIVGPQPLERLASDCGTTVAQ